MKIVSTTGGIAATNSFLVADEAAKVGVIFDAPNDTVEPLLEEAKKRGWEIIGLWLTHGHFDHLADHEVVKKAFPKAKVMIHVLDEPKLIKPNSSMFQLPFVIPPGKADGYLTDGQELAIGGLHVKVMHTPGHSPGHVVFYLAGDRLVVGGDMIIMGSVGRTDLPDSDNEQFAASIRKLMALPPKTQLLPGHGHPSTLEEEQQSNWQVKRLLK